MGYHSRNPTYQNLQSSTPKYQAPNQNEKGPQGAPINYNHNKNNKSHNLVPTNPNVESLGKVNSIKLDQLLQNQILQSARLTRWNQRTIQGEYKEWDWPLTLVSHVSLYVGDRRPLTYKLVIR